MEAEAGRPGPPLQAHVPPPGPRAGARARRPQPRLRGVPGPPAGACPSLVLFPGVPGALTLGTACRGLFVQSVGSFLDISRVGTGESEGPRVSGALPPEPGMHARRSWGVFHGIFSAQRVMRIDSCRH